MQIICADGFEKVAYEHSRINDRKECLVLGVMEVLGRCQDICISQTICDTTPCGLKRGDTKQKEHNAQLIQSKII